MRAASAASTVADGVRARPNPPLTYAGNIGGYDVTLTFSTDSLAGLILQATAVKTEGGQKVEAIKAEGHLHNMLSSSEIAIYDSQLQNVQYHNSDLQGDVNLEWHAFTSSAGASTLVDTATIKIPVAFTVPFVVGYIPVTRSIKANLALSPAIDDNRGSSGGSIKILYNSTTDIVHSGGTTTVTGTLGKAQFAISGETVTAGYIPTGFGLDVECPRVELRVLGAITAFASINSHTYGFYTPGTTFSADIKPCQKAGGSLTGYAGVKLSILGFDFLLGKKQLFKSQEWVKYLHDKKCD